MSVLATAQSFSIVACLSTHTSAVLCKMSKFCLMQVWDVDDLKRVLVLVGHEATVCCVAADETKVRYYLNLCAPSLLKAQDLLKTNHTVLPCNKQRVVNVECRDNSLSQQQHNSSTTACD
jgi:hypothetical protein